MALDERGERVLASADDLDAIENQIEAAGLDAERLIFDRIEDDDLMVGGAGMP